MEKDQHSIQNRESRLTSKPTWMRGLFMLIFAFGFGVCQTLIMLITFVQFLWLLFGGEPNKNLQKFGRSLSMWIAEATEFLTCAREEKPFPWSEWPSNSGS